MDTIFKRASLHAKNLASISDEQMLKLYGLYKQVTHGPCNISKPNIWDFTGKAKWESWKGHSNLSKDKAMFDYIELVKELDPLWDEEEEEKVQKSIMAVSVSTMAQDDDDLISDSDKTVFDWCKEGNLNELSKKLLSSDISPNCTDEYKMSLLHWSVDRGHYDVCEYLIEQGCDINAKDEDGQTPLHYAVTCDREKIVLLLLENGADPNIKDDCGLISYESSDSERIKSLLVHNSKIRN